MAMRAEIERSELADIDYVEAVSADRLRQDEDLNDSFLLAVAVRFGPPRLIDTILVSSDPQRPESA